MSTHQNLTGIIMLLLLTLPCLAEEQGRKADKHGEYQERPLVHRTAEELAAFGVTVEKAGPGKIDRGIELLGEVRPNGDALAHIVPRFPGIAITIRKTIGDNVKSGEVLATIQSNESLAPYELKTMIDGTIIEKHLTRGEAVERDKPTFVIADLSTVWIDLSVYQKDIHEVAVGQLVRVSCHHLPDVDGAISYIAPVVDQPTRTAIARVVLPNTDRAWRPGLFVSARLLDSTEAQIAIPRTAIQTIEDHPVVFVEIKDGFEARPIILGHGGESSVEVLSGLVPGERFVATNSFLLKAEFGKSAVEHGD